MGNIYDKKNAEGYSDPTPYQAIRNMIKPGEVWTFKKKDDTESEVLVVAFNDNVATILFLMDEYKDGCIEIVNINDLHDVMWVNPRMLNWTWGGYLCKRTRKLSDQGFDKILDAIEDVLGVVIEKKEVTPLVPELESKNEELKALRCRVQEYEKMVLAKTDELSMAQINASKYKTQLDLMKTMYAELMEKFLQRA